MTTTNTTFTAYRYQLPAWSIPAVFNGDESGLSDSESEALEQLQASLPTGIGHWTICSDNPEPYFRAGNDVAADEFGEVVEALYMVKTAAK